MQRIRRRCFTPTYRDITVPVAIPHRLDSRTHHRYGVLRTFSRIPKASGRYLVHCAVSGDSLVFGDDVVVMVFVEVDVLDDDVDDMLISLAWGCRDTSTR